MSRRNSVLAYVILIAFGILGAWLIGMFEGEKPAENISGLDMLLSFVGFFIFLGALIGIVLVIRQNMRPMSRKEIAGWEIIRRRGKRSYIRNAIVKGILFGLIGISWPVISDFWKVKSFSLIMASIWIYAALFLVCVFAAFYAALRIWDGNEKAYEALIQSKPQHNNGMHPTPPKRASHDS
jgi:TRAP-type C4-dicarboxylate transport system permease small subunit